MRRWLMVLVVAAMLHGEPAAVQAQGVTCKSMWRFMVADYPDFGVDLLMKAMRDCW